jgi:putative membrane protein
MSILAIIGSVFIGLAALVHVYIFTLESITWSTPKTWKTFGLKTQEEADITKPMAYNQGFYNLFLALGAGTGLVLFLATPLVQAGFALAAFAALSMVLAALVLITSSPKLARAAALQGGAPLIGTVLLVLSVVL